MIGPDVVVAEEEVVDSEGESRQDKERFAIDALPSQSVRLFDGPRSKAERARTTRTVTLAIPLSPSSSSKSGISSKNRIGMSVRASEASGMPG